MDRRTFLGALVSGFLTAPIGAKAQPVGKFYRVGLIFPSPPVSEMAGPEPVNNGARAFIRGLRALGYVEGRNLILDAGLLKGDSRGLLPSWPSWSAST